MDSTLEWITAVTAVLSALFAGAGLFAASKQLRYLADERSRELRLGTEGVSVSWYPKAAPAKGDVRDGYALWTWIFRVDNPGRFPIDGIQADIDLGVPGKRLRHDATFEDLSSEVTLRHSVLQGGAHREWTRRILLPWIEDDDARPPFTAVVRFVDADGTEQVRVWPRPAVAVR
jgi:hypothetical protein